MAAMKRTNIVLLICLSAAVAGVSMASLQQRQGVAVHHSPELGVPPQQASLPPANPAGRRYPPVPRDPAATARLLEAVEGRLRDPTTAADALPDLGHQQQVIYRVLSQAAERSDAVRAHLSRPWQAVFDHHIGARRELLAMHRGGPGLTSIPPWRIIEPEQAPQLLAHYRKAESATGIPWQVLAGVNLVETGMGRIDGLSVSGARGPMQFLPTTWAERGIGAGSIDDPHDAIQAAARYLVRRGGLLDIRKGLWGYNNSDNYGRAVLHYAALLEQDPRAFQGLYHWEIHVRTEAGDLWLPVGFETQQPLPVSTYLRQAPWSAPPP